MHMGGMPMLRKKTPRLREPRGLDLLLLQKEQNYDRAPWLLSSNKVLSSGSSASFCMVFS
jgi:hypothetical protein